MATEMHPPYSSGVVKVDDKAVKDYESRGFTRVAAKSADEPKPKKKPSK